MGHVYDTEWILENYNGRCGIEFFNKYLEESNDHTATMYGIRTYISRKLGLKGDRHIPNEQVEFVKAHYGELGRKECAKALGCPISRIDSIIRQYGLKMSKEDFEKHVPTYENTYPIGSIRERNHNKFFIKTENGWENLGRYIWEKHNGPIPENHYIVFLNGDHSDGRIENLACVSKRVVSKLNRFKTDNEELMECAIKTAMLELAIYDYKKGANK